MADAVAELRVSHTIHIDLSDPVDGEPGTFNARVAVEPRTLTITIPLDASHHEGDLMDHHVGWLTIPADSPIGQIIAPIAGSIHGG